MRLGQGGGNDFNLFFREFLVHYTYTFSKDEKKDLINWIKTNSNDEKVIPDETPLNSHSKLVQSGNEYMLPPESSLIMPILRHIANDFPVKRSEIISATLSFLNENDHNERILSFIRLRIIFVLKFLENSDLIKGYGRMELTEKGGVLVGLDPEEISENQMLKLLMKYPMEEVFRFYEL
jgi:hypothetical protein